MSPPPTNPLRRNLQKWKDIGASNTVLDWISSGVHIPFTEVPPDYCGKNRYFSQNEEDFIASEIHRLCGNGSLRVIHPWDEKPVCISPINCVPKKNNKFRLVTDLRFVNKYCVAKSFQNENIKTVLEIVKPHDKLITIDIKDGFFHVPVSLSSQRFLGIRFKNTTYVWTCLPFGCSISPYYFCKVIRSVLTYLRSQGLGCSVYVDDFISAESEQVIENSKVLILNTLEELGFIVNYDKSSLEPDTRKLYVGYTIETSNPDNTVHLSIPKQRITRLKHDIKLCLKKGRCSARKLASIAGQCISMTRVIVPGKLMLRNIYRLLRQRSSWQHYLDLDSGSILDLKWWIDGLSAWNGLSVYHRTIQLQIITDASAVGWGGILCSVDSDIPQMSARGLWNLHASSKASNVRESMAVLLTLQSFLPRIKGQCIQVLSDNVSTVANINFQGGPSAELTRVAKAIWDLSLQNDISISAKHIAGSKNQTADYLSRVVSCHDYRLHKGVFQFVDHMWGPHSVDRCASFLTRQLPRYNSLYADPESEGIDCLAQQNWTTENNFVCPPFRLIPKILRVLQAQRARATLVAPWWPGQPWFRMLCRMCLVPPIRIPNNPKTFLSLGTVPEPLRNPRWKIFTWRISGEIV